MRWYKPCYGKARTIKRFAFLPIAIGCEVRWLEMVTIQQTYSGISEFDTLYWKNERFAENGERRESETVK